MKKVSKMCRSMRFCHVYFVNLFILAILSFCVPSVFTGDSMDLAMCTGDSPCLILFTDDTHRSQCSLVTAWTL